MNASRYATTAHNGDAMDIDVESPVYIRPSYPGNQRSLPTPGQPHEPISHLFYIPLQVTSTRMSELDILCSACTYLFNRQHSDTHISQSLPVGTGVPHLYIRIDTQQNDRDDALEIASRRLGLMLEMTQDGLGWISLPYRHSTFEVKFIRNRYQG